VTSSFITTPKRHQTNGIKFFYFGLLPIKISGYASGYDYTVLQVHEYFILSYL